MSRIQLILCDDVRQEMSGKLVIIGAYTTAVCVPETPLSHQASLAVVVSEMEPETNLSFRMNIVGPSPRFEAPSGEIPITSDANGRAVLWFNQVPLEMEQLGDIEFWCSVGHEKMRCVERIPVTLQQGAE